MKRIHFFMVLGIMFLISMISCKSNSELDLDKTLSFSKLSVEEQKSKIEQSGIDFVNAMDGIQDTKAFKAMSDLSDMGTASQVIPFSKLKADLMRHDRNVLKNFDKKLRVVATDSTIWGEWSWNETKGNFEKTSDLKNKVIVHFPGDSTKTTNNGLATLTYVESTVLAPESDQYYPSSVTFEMKIDGTSVMSAEFTGTYKSDGTPTNVKQTLQIEKYKWTAQITNSTDKFTESYEFKHDNQTLIKITSEANGNFTSDNLNNAASPEEVISSGAVYYQLMNIAILGGVKDFKAFANDAKALDNKTFATDMAKNQAKADVLNKHVILYGYYVDDNKKFADVEFYPVESSSEYYDYYTQQYVTETSYSLEPRFILSDGSKVAIQDYLQTGFDDLISKLESYQNQYGGLTTTN